MTKVRSRRNQLQSHKKLIIVSGSVLMMLTFVLGLFLYRHIEQKEKVETAKLELRANHEVVKSLIENQKTEIKQLQTEISDSQSEIDSTKLKIEEQDKLVVEQDASIAQLQSQIDELEKKLNE